MFDGFTTHRLPGEGAEIFARAGGNTEGPPVLLLHGYPQTSAMWDVIAQDLAEDYFVVCLDLRGYGQSEKPATTPDHAPYSKRAMAADMVAVMRALGHTRFYVGAHDRGGRVAHRLGLDHENAAAAMTILDIAPTREMYAATDMSFASAYWHWFFLIQPYPVPERLIEGDPEGFWLRKCVGLGAGGKPFSPEAQDEYLRAFKDPATIHASCEDYRAAATIDIQHDNEDQGKKLTMPIDVLWGSLGVIERNFDALALWRQRAEQVTGEVVPGSHYFAEEIPGEIAARMRAHFAKTPL